MNVVSRALPRARGGSPCPALLQGWPAWLVLASNACGIDDRVVGVAPGPDNDLSAQDETGSAPRDMSSRAGVFSAPGVDRSSSAEGCTPTGDEVCDVELQDENCDGAYNEGCACEEGRTTTCSQAVGALGACGARSVTCTGGTWPAADCAPTSPELCDPLFDDEDCDGQNNEAPPCPTLTEVAASQGHACALTSGGRVLCWGVNYAGEVGDGSTERRPTPIEVLGVSGARSLAAADGLSCAILDDQSARCWGQQTTQPFGEEDPATGPARVTVFPQMLALAADSTGLCAVLPDRTVSCTGRAIATPSAFTPEGVADVQAIASNLIGYCAVVTSGAARCWSGNLAEGWSVSVPVQGLVGAVDIRGGGTRMCARLASGGVSCWEFDQVSPETNEYRLGAAAPVPGIEGAVAISVSTFDACAVLADGTAACWGDLVDGPTPVELPDLQDVADITVLTVANNKFIIRLQSGEVFSVRSYAPSLELTPFFVP